MTNAERLQRWNQMYERTPEPWRFQLVVWALVIIGAVNMLLTIAVGFPFALLLGLAIAAMAVVRVPYAMGWLKADGGAEEGAGARMEIRAPDWVLRVNRWYDGLDEMQRPLVLLAALAIPGALNMLLTFAGGFPFGLLFLLAVLAVIAVRAPYAAGWLNEKPAAGATVGAPALAVGREAPRLGNDSAGMSSTASPASRPAEPVPVVPAQNPPAGDRPPAAGAPPAEPPR
jgi:type III secretory pathway component EscV